MGDVGWRMADLGFRIADFGFRISELEVGGWVGRFGERVGGFAGDFAEGQSLSGNGFGVGGEPI